uniref:Uncharacterized protein n=1 Tax=Setaria viridis TaxID=4556 RepID=A0A4V6D4L1_SETVI|nr:hypothetical protein SEVIR_7G247750v2 [Setaria viridis]
MVENMRRVVPIRRRHLRLASGREGASSARALHGRRGELRGTLHGQQGELRCALHGRRMAGGGQLRAGPPWPAGVSSGGPRRRRARVPAGMGSSVRSQGVSRKKISRWGKEKGRR